VSNKKPSSIRVKIFNITGISIDIVSADNANEVRWQTPSLRQGIYIYVMKIISENGRKENHRGVLEVQK